MMVRIKDNGLNLVVYPNDHLPPHVHVLGPGWEVRISICGKSELMTITGNPKLQEIALAAEVVSRNMNELKKIWRSLHD